MSYSVKKTTITMTRGDTFKAQISLTDSEGRPYEPVEGDHIRFAVKKNWTDLDKNVLINKEIPTDTLILTLVPADTKDLEFGEYVYDIQFSNSAGEVDTFIDRAVFILTEEVC